MAVKRSVFEEVGDGQAPAPVQGTLIARDTGPARRATARWLAVLFGLVTLMILVGGATRLTDSGLSITEWRPVTGALPPMDDAAWQAEFEKYQAIPQYRLTNQGMSLEAFKSIYWWEWGHRQLGRVIGLVWAVGFALLALTRRVPPGWAGRLFLLGGLGGLQGAIGWWMVSSGLEGEATSVASYRLAVHLGLAFAILGLIAWFTLRLARPEGALLQARRGREGKLFSMSTGLMHLAFLQILLGALVAGIDAGRAFPTWPLMGDGFLPPDPFQLTPWWRNFFEDAGLVQFIHRLSGYVLAVFAVVVWLRGRRSAHRVTRRAFHLVLAMIGVQVALGIWAVLSQAQLHVALTHQFGALVLWVLILRTRFYSQYPLAGSIREGTA